jgi:hypothetical protein
MITDGSNGFFDDPRTAAWALAYYEAMAVILKGQIPNIDGRDMRAQTVFVASLIERAA